jgi:hypothetical protein
VLARQFRRPHTNSDGYFPPADLAATRAARYRQLADEQHRSWILVMTEAALNWHVGSPALMAEQMQHLIEASRLPNVRLGIIQTRTPARVFASGGFDMHDSRGVPTTTAKAACHRHEGNVQCTRPARQ